MVVVSTLSRGDRVMTGPTWLICSFLPLILLLEQSRAFGGGEKLYGDVTDEEVVIDRLDDYQRHRDGQDLGANFGPPSYEYNLPDFHSALKMGEKIDFAVPPTDPRYYLPSSVLRTGEMPRLDQIASLEQSPPLEHLPSEEISKGAELHPSKNPSHHPTLLQELYSRFSPMVYGQDVAGFSEGAEGDNSFYKGHKFGPIPVEKNKDSESSDPESVNFLQNSKHQAQVPQYYVQQPENSAVISDFYFVALVSGCTAAAVCAVVGAGICYLRLHKSKRDAADAEYPAYGVTGPCKDFSPAAADRKLAQSAHMFHYQHQKQQMIALEKSSGDERHCSTSDVDSEEEGEEGDYTVYECPGLAPTDEMEVKNPLFSDDPTPATPARQKGASENKEEEKEEEEE